MTSLPGVPVSRRWALGLLGGASFAGATAVGLGVAEAGTATARRGVAEAGVPARAGTPAAQPPDALRPGGTFDRSLRQLAEQDAFSGTVLLAHRGEPVLSRAYGMADKARSVPNRTDTIFALASITKTFTGLAIMQLAAQEKVRLYRTVGSYLTGFPPTVADTVTVHHLLTHTSGLGDYVQSPDYRAGLAQWNSERAMMDGIMAIIRRSQPQFTPGTGWSYSNSGYVVLGAIVAQLSGQSYYDYVREHIFAAAGMTRTDFYTNPQWQTDPRIAHPYATQPGGGRADVASQLGFIGSPAGNAFSTAPDLLRFARALWAGRLVNTAYTELMTSAKVPVFLGTDPPANRGDYLYGYGLGETILNAQRIVWHNGGGPGISTNLDMYPALDWTEIRLSNYDGATTIDQQVRQILTTPQ